MRPRSFPLTPEPALAKIDLKPIAPPTPTFATTAIVESRADFTPRSRSLSPELLQQTQWAALLVVPERSLECMSLFPRHTRPGRTPINPTTIVTARVLEQQ
jgi:hypothetical protein